MSPSRNWDSPTPLTASECALPPGPKGGGAYSPAAKGVGEFQFRRWRKSLALCLLCGLLLLISSRNQRFASTNRGEQYCILCMVGLAMKPVLCIFCPHCMPHPRHANCLHDNRQWWHGYHASEVVHCPDHSFQLGAGGGRAFCWGPYLPTYLQVWSCLISLCNSCYFVTIVTIAGLCMRRCKHSVPGRFVFWKIRQCWAVGLRRVGPLLVAMKKLYRGGEQR
jgi:hypothetical protein